MLSFLKPPQACLIKNLTNVKDHSLKFLNNTERLDALDSYRSTGRTKLLTFFLVTSISIHSKLKPFLCNAWLVWKLMSSISNLAFERNGSKNPVKCTLPISRHQNKIVSTVINISNLPTYTELF